MTVPPPLWWASYAAWAAGVVAVTLRINTEVNEPYMDEIFHVPQAQAYCRGEWTRWDGALTTPPGLYLLPAVFSHIQHFLSQHLPASITNHLPAIDPCTLSSLRALNLSLVLVLPFLYISLLRLMHDSRPQTVITSPDVTVYAKRPPRQVGRAIEWEALVIALHPLVGWWAWLYYTDLFSLATVLLCWREGLLGRPYRAAALGAASLWFRQTNIIWLGFVAAQMVVTRLASPSFPVFHDPLLTLATLSDLIRTPLSLLRAFAAKATAAFSALAPFCFIFGAGVSFVRWNGGIVLGDKQNHVAVLHVPQLYYFVAFAGAFFAPSLLSPRKLKKASLGLVGSWSRATLSMLAIAGMCWTIKRFTIAHPFLLADNRHYSFYLWRRVINVHPLARYALAPAYLVAARLLFDELARAGTMRLSTFLLFAFSTVAVLVPTPLLEPRYFLIPLVLLRLYLSPAPSSSSNLRRRTKLALEAALYLAIQAVCVWLFLRRTFVWEVTVGEDGKGLEGRDEREVGRVQRFMW